MAQTEDSRGAERMDKAYAESPSTWDLPPGHLHDGQTTEWQGSAAKPYILKNVGGVYSCSCPAWKNQSLPIDKRTCKHLCAFRGYDLEMARIGKSEESKAEDAYQAWEQNGRSSVKEEKKQKPGLLLANNWDGKLDPTGWLASEKLDGLRGYWNGKDFISRDGNVYYAPAWFKEGLPPFPLDGELWLGRGRFQATSSIVRRYDAGKQWEEVRYMVFDAPEVYGAFTVRMEAIFKLFNARRPKYSHLLPHEYCKGITHLKEELARVEQKGGEGIILRNPESHYEAGRSNTILKVKSFIDAECTITEYEAGKGKYKGMMGALWAKLDNGIEFKIGTGFTDADRKNPPKIGDRVTFKYIRLTDVGKPFHASFLRVRED